MSSSQDVERGLQRRQELCGSLQRFGPANSDAYAMYLGIKEWEATYQKLTQMTADVLWIADEERAFRPTLAARNNAQMALVKFQRKNVGDMCEIRQNSTSRRKE